MRSLISFAKLFAMLMRSLISFAKLFAMLMRSLISFAKFVDLMNSEEPVPTYLSGTYPCISG